MKECFYKMAKVLIVDDSKIIRKGLRSIMEMLGHEVVAEAINGFDGIEKFKQFKPEIVTMDVTMPEVNGISNGVEAVKYIVQEDENAVVIMVTAHGEESKVMQSIEYGALGYVLKPITGEKIKNALKKVGY
jgi:two-component system chemotaxis response regulator CheY